MTSKYQVGDTVRISDPLPVGQVGVTDFMKQQVGKTAVIGEVIAANTTDGYVYRLAGMPGYNWESIMFELATEIETSNDEDIPDLSFGSFLTGFEVV